MKRGLFSALAFALTIGMVYGVDPPSLREGLWSIHTQTINNPGSKKDEASRSMCRNHAYDDRVRATAKRVNCKVISENLSGGTLTTENECTVAGTVVKTQAKVTMSGDTSAHSETHTTYTPAMYGMAETTMIMDQKYVGACPAGMAPGDMMNANGEVVHRGRQGVVLPDLQKR